MNPHAMSQFAKRYRTLFEWGSDEELCQLCDSLTFPEECRALGFKMDCGHSFIDAYGEESWNYVAGLQKAMPQIDDPQLLGSAIFSHWRYFNHWAYEPITVAREWFVLAFHRLCEISSKEIPNHNHRPTR